MGREKQYKINISKHPERSPAARDRNKATIKESIKVDKARSLKVGKGITAKIKAKSPINMFKGKGGTRGISGKGGGGGAGSIFTTGTGTRVGKPRVGR